jgi:DNA-binding PadR family transcriptional regulator
MADEVAGKLYIALWPLPGGHGNFLSTLQHVLEWVNDHPDAMIDDSIAWMRNAYSLKGRSTAPAYLETIRTMGYLRRIGKSYALTDAGIYYLQTKDKEFVVHGLLTECVGAWETLSAIKKLGSATLNATHKELQDHFPQWKSNSQPAWRIHWLFSLGCVQKLQRGKGYSITPLGEKALKTYKSPLDLWLVADRHKKRARSAFTSVPSSRIRNVEPSEADIPADALSALVLEVLRTAQAGDEATEFERCLTKAFTYLGFQAEHKSGSGDTDILLTAPLGQETYRVIVDGKSSRHGKVGASAISWPALGKHWQMYNADYCLIIAPGFSSGDLYSFAKDNGAALITASDLCAIMQMHNDTPFSLADLREMFSYPGEPTQPIDKMKMRSAEIARLQQLISEVIRELAGLDQEPVSAEGLYFLMRKSTKSDNYSRNEIRDALVLLSSPIINALHEVAEGYVLQMPAATILRRLQAQARCLKLD